MKKEACRNFLRGSCQYGDRCKFLHTTPKPNNNTFGFGGATSQSPSQSQHHQSSNPFGFGSSKQNNQFKPFENKWTRFSPTGNNSGSRQPDNNNNNKPVSAEHKCTDPDTCKRLIIEDFEHEKPMWKLTCYGHCKSAPCDIVGDISSEELRAAAYNDASSGLSLQSIVERERSLLNAKLLEFENLLRNPYVPKESSMAMQSASTGFRPRAQPAATPNNMLPSVSSFTQFGGSLNIGFVKRPATSQSFAFGQQNSTKFPSQTQSGYGTISLPFGTAGVVGDQYPNQLLGTSSAFTTATFSNSATSMEQNTSPASSQTSVLAIVQSPVYANGFNSESTTASQLSSNGGAINMPRANEAVDDSIWIKEEWHLGDIPEEAPPDKYIYG